MTKARDPASFEDAILRCIAGIGPDEAGAVVGKTSRLVRYWADPDDDRKAPIDAAFTLDREMQARGLGHPIVDAYLDRLRLSPSGRAGACPMQAFLGVAREVGEVAGAVTRAMEDGRIDLRERREITERAHGLINEIRKLIEAVEPASPAAVDALR